MADLHYKRYNDLCADIKCNINKIPSNIDMIVGIPRSGMIPAYMIGLAKNLPVCSIGEFISGSFLLNIKSTCRAKLDTDITNILIIDDSVNTGRAMKIIRDEIKSLKLDKKYNIKYAAVYCSPGTESMIDIGLCTLQQPRMFQWNYLNHSNLQNAALDIDGVLCIDPTKNQNDDGVKYCEFLKNADPLYIPQYKVAALVTSRLGKYRSQTEHWMKEHGVQYGKLYMLENTTAAERRAQNLHAAHKAKIYKQLTNTNLFIESDPTQAREIARLSGKLCFCATTDELFGIDTNNNFDIKKPKYYTLRRIVATFIPSRKIRRKIRNGGI